MIKKKEGWEFSFSWMFAIIVGIVIIFLAVYASTKILRTGEYQQGSETAKELTTILDPLESSIDSARAGTINIGEEVRVYDDCYTDGIFGRQRFSIAGKKSFSDEYGEKGAGTEISNKYIFTESIMEGKEYYYLTKSFSMPFKVADVIIMTSKNYCFIQTPTSISEEIQELSIKNIKLSGEAKGCADNEIKVCFLGTGGIESSNCAVKVVGQGGSFEQGYTDKGDDRVYYKQNLIYASIIADKKNYECNLKRLIMRTDSQAALYLSEAQYLSTKGCNTGMELQLSKLSNGINGYDSPIDLITKVAPAANSIEENNICDLW